MRVSKQAVIGVACDIADEQGLGGVTLKAVAEKLAIRAPSLYNHIENLDELLREVALAGMTEMNRRMTRCAIGVAGEQAVSAIACEYLGYMVEHPGIYETIQWATWHSDERIRASFEAYLSLIRSVIGRCGFGEADIGEITDLLTGFLHGYATMQLHLALENFESAKVGLKDAVNTVMTGIVRKYAGKTASGTF